MGEQAASVRARRFISNCRLRIEVADPAEIRLSAANFLLASYNSSSVRPVRLRATFLGVGLHDDGGLRDPRLTLELESLKVWWSLALHQHQGRG